MILLSQPPGVLIIGLNHHTPGKRMGLIMTFSNVCIMYTLSSLVLPLTSC
jgi:hypothetical protein